MNIRVGKIAGHHQRAVYVGFCGKVDKAINLISLHRAGHRVWVTDIPPHKYIAITVALTVFSLIRRESPISLLLNLSLIFCNTSFSLGVSWLAMCPASISASRANFLRIFPAIGPEMAASPLAHQLAAAGDEAGLAAVEAQVDEAAAELWGITDTELQEIRRSLVELG